MKLFAVLLATFIAVLLSWPSSSRAQSDGPIALLTGSTTGTYLHIGEDIARVTRPSGLKVLTQISRGSLDNVKRLVSGEGGALAIVQSDVLGFMVRSNEPKLRQAAQELRLVFPLYEEEVHLFASTAIQSFDDLVGKQVVLGDVNSGNWLTGMNLLWMTGVSPAGALYLPPLEAVMAVLEGRADAMFFVGGKPVALFSNLSTLKNDPHYAPLFDKVHFVPLEDTIMLREYDNGKIGPADYAWVTAPVPTITVKAMLIARDFSGTRKSDRRRCLEMAELVRVIRANINWLRNTGHPKWKQVDLDQKARGWRLDSCSR